MNQRASHSQGEVIVDRERRMIREALVEIDVLAASERGDAGRREVVVHVTKNLQSQLRTCLHDG
jgi:hypothetical protein